MVSFRRKKNQRRKKNTAVTVFVALSLSHAHTRSMHGKRTLPVEIHFFNIVQSREHCIYKLERPVSNLGLHAQKERLADVLCNNNSVSSSPPENNIFSPCLTRPLWDDLNQSIFHIIQAVFFYVLPMAMMALTYTHVASVLWRHEIPGVVVATKNYGQCKLQLVLFFTYTNSGFIST